MGLPAVLTLAFGCGDGTLNPPPLVPDRELYWALDLNHHAVLMSSANPLYDTLTLIATPRNRYGEALQALGTPHFTSPNPEQLLVSPTGQLTAVAPTNQPLPVVASLTAGNLRHEDTVYVIVVDDPAPPRLANFSAHPPDSAKLGAQSFALPQGSGSMSAVLPVHATDSNGDVMSDLPVSLRSSDPRVLMISMPLNGKIMGVRPGTAKIYASTTAFGVTKTDTVPYQIGWPVASLIAFEQGVAGERQFNPSTITVGVGALIMWFRSSEDTLDVTFQDADLPHVAAAPETYGAWDRFFADYIDLFHLPASFLLDLICNNGVNDCGDGNIVGLTGMTVTAFRVLTTPGTYEYYSPRYGIRGRVIVVDDAVSAQAIIH